MKQLVRLHTISFKNAFEGLKWTLKTQPNYRIHFLFSLISIIAGFILDISYTEWLVILLLIIIGLVIETINTTIEVAADAIDKRWSKDIMILKDVSAASMLIFAMGAAIIAIIIFVPKILQLFS